VTPTLSALIPTTGRRASLGVLVDAVLQQFLPGDELIVDCSVGEPFGYAARRRMQARAKGDYLIFMDDDDLWLPTAFATIRAGVASEPERVHLFRMRWEHDGRVIWTDREVREGNVSTQMVAVPNGCPGVWGDRYAGDYDFVRSSCDALGEPVWHEEIVASVGLPFHARGGTVA